MRALHPNRFVDALLKVLLLSASVHLVILAVIAAKERQIAALNYFAILELHRFWPALSQTWQGDVAAVLLALALYVFFLFRRRT